MGRHNYNRTNIKMKLHHYQATSVTAPEPVDDTDFVIVQGINDIFFDVKKESDIDPTDVIIRVWLLRNIPDPTDASVYGSSYYMTALDNEKPIVENNEFIAHIIPNNDAIGIYIQVLQGVATVFVSKTEIK